MRSLLWFALSTTVFATTAVAALPAPYDAPAGMQQQLQGDTDCDGDVDAADALDVLKFVAGLESPVCLQSGGDVDCDFAITAADALTILRFLAGLPPGGPPAGCPNIGQPLPPAPQANGYQLSDPIPNVAYPEMIGLAVVPGQADAAIVYTLTGQLYRISVSGAFPPTPFGDVSSLITDPLQGDEGLVAAAFEPGDPDHIYLNYTAGAHNAYYDPGEEQPSSPSSDIPDDPKRNVIARFAIAANAVDIASQEIIIEVLEPHWWHNVNDIVFDDEGLMYVGAGDGGGLDAMYDSNHGQDATNLLATVFRIDPNPPGTPGYTIPPGNPFADGPDGPNADEVWAFGLRNPWRMSFDTVTGRLWAGDVGEFYWEEINEIIPGANYGWEIIEGPYGELNSCHAPGCPPAPPNYRDPRASYCHTFVFTCPYKNPDADTAVIGGFVYHGPSMPELEGWYIYGDLGSVRIRAFNASSDVSPPLVIAESSRAPCTNCLRSFAQLPDGEILAITAPYGGEPSAIYRLTRAPEPTPTPAPLLTPTAAEATSPALRPDAKEEEGPPHGRKAPPVHPQGLSR
jgi:glucose/arabinose dehydrogenase